MSTSGIIGSLGSLTPIIGADNLPKYNKWLWFRIPLFDYRYATPDMTFIDEVGVAYQLDHHFVTDGGSIPPIVRMCPGIHLDPFNFPRAYLFHDCGYQYGGLYIKYPGEEVFKFRLMSRQQVDDLLSKLLPFDGATAADVRAIDSAIWIGSRFVWNDKKPALQKQARKDGGVVVHDFLGNVLPE